MMRHKALYLILFLSLACCYPVFCQLPDMVYKSNIKTVRLHKIGDQLSVPIINLNSSDQLELSFDDLDANVKSYYYAFQLCDYDWQPVDINSLTYIKGFTQQRISNYRYSSIALTRYTHYQAFVPDRNTTIKLSGNYLLKVFLDGDTGKLAFTRRMMVADQKASIVGKVVQPYNPQIYQTDQKLLFSTTVTDINSFSAAQQVKVVILQNNRWDNAAINLLPTFVRGNVLEYNSEDIIFPAGKEWRWLDLRNFHLQSDRVDSAVYKKASTDVYVMKDIDRGEQRYAYFRDYNGYYSVETYESINPYWQGDYATVHFSFAPAGNRPFAGKTLYLNGQFTGNMLDNAARMNFNEERGVYEGTAFLKQGYYNYTYTLVDDANPNNRMDLEGNYWETENVYTVLIYYRSMTDRADQLLGVATINSRTDRPGISF